MWQLVRIPTRRCIRCLAAGVYRHGFESIAEGFGRNGTSCTLILRSNLRMRSHRIHKRGIAEWKQRGWLACHGGERACHHRQRRGRRCTTASICVTRGHKCASNFLVERRSHSLEEAAERLALQDRVQGCKVILHMRAACKHAVTTPAACVIAAAIAGRTTFLGMNDMLAQRKTA